MRGGVWGVADARRLVLVGLLVSVARWLEMLVVGVLAWQQTGSALVVALLTLLRLVPLVALGAVAGVLADRVPRRAALAGVLAAQAATLAVLAALAFGGVLAVWHLAAATLLLGAGSATDNPVRRMLLGDAAGPARLSAAMSLDVLAANASRAVGPVLGGAILAALGAGPAFLLGAALLALAVVVALRVGGGRGRQAGGALGLWRETRESFALALRLPALRAVLVVTVVYNLSGWPGTSMVPVIGGEHGLGPEGIGILAGMEGVGALVGALASGALARGAGPGAGPGAGAVPRRFVAIYVGGAAASMLGVMAFALAPGPIGAALGMAAAGVGAAGFAVMQATLVYLVVPPALRGRSLGLLSVAVGTGLAGFLQVGLLAEWLGASAAVTISGLQGLAALALLWPVWRVLLRPLPPRPAPRA